jgi:molybdopterin/thiamine biosynthesis adenylyltransferase
MRPRPWFDRWPAFLERQCRALEDAGIPYRIDEDLRARGVLVLEVTPTIDGQVLRLIVAFPATFPYTRFEIHAPTLDLKHHQHPFSKTLCFIGRRTRNWHESDRVADYLRQRLPRVLRAGRSEDRTEVEGIEEPQAEPFSDYYAHSCEKDAIVLLGAAPALDPADAGGELVIGIPDDMGDVLRGAVVAIKDMTGKVLSEADPALTRLYSRQLRGRWVRLQSPIREADPERFYWALVGAHPELARPEWRGVRGWKIDIVGVVFPDEVGWREAGDGWIFLVRGEELKDPGRKKTKKYLVRGALAGRSDLAARVPELRALAEKKIALIGLGGIGGPSALEFARAGIGDLRILDGDIIDPGTAVRWPFGFGVAGLRKTDVIKDFVREQYPYVRVRAWHRRLGMIAMDRPSDLEILDEVLDGVSLIYDATAEVGIQHLLADLARERGVPYICVSSTAGAWGGLLIRLRPKETEGCWVCSQWALQDKTIPVPPADPKAGVQPAGCADPTFTGSGFDLAQVSSAGVRLAVGTVLAGTADAYPDVAWDVAVISLRERGGQIIVPRVETFPLRRHPSCKCGDG